MLSFTFLGFYDTMKRYGSSEKGCRNLFWGGDAPMLFWIVGVVAIVCVIGRFVNRSDRSGFMTERQFYRDEYRNEWREVNDPLLIDLKMRMRLP